ncbi:MAG: GTP cyclohydrolase I FolE [Oligoflexia bacterium]|nr:GTP cyclohydrolase I FolE [Oligoflexia bacterium]
MSDRHAQGPTPDRQAAAAHIAQALHALGFPDDPEMARTPDLVAHFLAELLPRPLPALTPLQTTSHDLIVLRELPVYSVCAHHLLPFFGTATIAYRPDARIAGLGWFPRLIDALARRPQLQERLVDQLAQAIDDALAPRGLGVVLQVRQLCVELRGARSTGIYAVTATRGDLDPALSAALRG